jgi:hypothetical protein
LQTQFASQVDVPQERQFIGFSRNLLRKIAESLKGIRAIHGS